MKNILFILLLCPVITLRAQEETSSLDFTVNGINYTILNENDKTCQTKAGKSEIQYTDGTGKIVITYGNDITGDITVPSVVTKVSSDGSDPQSYKVVAIGSHSFGKVSSVILSPGITTINSSAFSVNTLLSSVVIQDPDATLGNNVFSGCTNLSSITLPANLNSIPNYSFSECKSLKEITLPENISYIGENAFSSCTGLQNIELPNSVLQLGKYAFYGCSGLKSVRLSDSLSALPMAVFSGCYSLTSITLPASLNSIAEYALNCRGLQTIISNNINPPAISYNSFYSSNYSSTVLYVYKTAYTNYEKSTLWGNFMNKEMIAVQSEGITLTPSTLNLNVGLSGQLKAALYPTEALGDITWTILNASPENCITVDNNGKVVGRNMGTATVRVSCEEYSADCNVVVTSNSLERVQIVAPASNIYVGDEIILSANILPSTIIPNLEWSSSNPSVAAIETSTGRLKALAPGATVITATNNGVSGKLTLVVNEIYAESISLDQTQVTLKTGESVTLKATVSPANVTYPYVIWETSDPAVAVVAEGVVTAIGVGSANIKASCGGYTSNCIVTVDPIPVESIVLTPNNATLKIGQSLQIGASVYPENATDKTITWTSTDNTVATVSLEGEIYAISKGSANINAIINNVQATCVVTVEEIAADELIINYSAITMNVGGVQQLTATIYPDNTTNQNIIWTSSNEEVVTVVNGLVSALSVGEALVTASNGDKSATCLVTVEPILAQQVILQESSITVNVGSLYALTGIVLPQDVTDATIVWNSLNEEVAAVAGGIVRGLAPGTTIVTAACGNAVASCAVTVLQPATAISLNETSLNLQVGELFDLIESVEPSNTTDIVVWSSSDDNIAMVDENGIITALNPGYVTITALCGSVTAFCNVTVSEIPAEEIILDAYNLTLKKGESLQLQATVLPQTTTNPVISWASSNASVASVSQDGAITANNPGNATISAICGNAFATCTVTVTADTSSVESLKEDPKFDGIFRVYYLNGIHILTTSDINKIYELPKGLYLINGVRIFITQPN